MAGRSSGVRPTASASAKRNESTTGRCEIDVDGEDRDHEEQGDLNEQPAEAPEPVLELRLGRAEPEPLGDPAEHRVRAGLHHDGTARPAHHVRPLEERVRSLRERRIGGEVARALLGGVALARQRGFVDEEVGGTKDPAVGRHGRARRKDDHIAGHERVLRQLDLVAVAQHRHRRLDRRPGAWRRRCSPGTPGRSRAERCRARWPARSRRPSSPPETARAPSRTAGG